MLGRAGRLPVASACGVWVAVIGADPSARLRVSPIGGRAEFFEELVHSTHLSITKLDASKRLSAGRRSGVRRPPTTRTGMLTFSHGLRYAGGIRNCSEWRRRPSPLVPHKSTTIPRNGLASRPRPAIEQGICDRDRLEDQPGAENRDPLWIRMLCIKRRRPRLDRPLARSLARPVARLRTRYTTAHQRALRATRAPPAARAPTC